jgi:hypothetical protein
VDPWVRKFFGDLVEAVEHRAAPLVGMRPGLIDQEGPPGSDINATLAEALGTAEVFVALYSPIYFKNPWPTQEREAFRRRLERLASSSLDERVLPVLWIPFPQWESPPEAEQAIAIGEDVPEYVENGLRALCMLSYYHEQYREIVGRIATRIVDTAQGSPLPPDSGLVLERKTPPNTKPAFVAAVLAPTLDLSRSAVYGATSVAWRPFADEQVLPAADYVASAAERLGLVPTKITDFAGSEELFNKCPAVLLIDPLTLGADDSEGLLLARIKTLPPWVRPLVVLNDAAPSFTRADHFAREMVAMLGRAGVANPERVGQLQDFVDIMPTLVTEARRQFLKHGPVSSPPGDPGLRLRLTDPDNSPTTSTGTINDE